MNSQKNDIRPLGLFESKKSFLISLLSMSVILAFYHQWYEILVNRPQDFVSTFYQNFPLTTLQSFISLLPLLFPFYTFIVPS